MVDGSVFIFLYRNAPFLQPGNVKKDPRAALHCHFLSIEINMAVENHHSSQEINLLGGGFKYV